MSFLTRLFASSPPDAAIEIAAEAVSGAVVVARGGQPTVQAYAVEALSPGAVAPSLMAENLKDRVEVARGLGAVLDRLGTRPKRVALVVPDLITRVSLVKFDQVPPGQEDLEQLIRWQLKKSAPFALEEAVLTCIRGAVPPEGGQEFLVALARREAVREYESICEEAGLHAGIVDLSTFGVANSVLASGTVPSGDWLLVHRRADYTSIVIMRGADVIFFRNRPEGDGDPLAELVHQTTMYYQDRLSGQGFSRILFGGAGRAADDVDSARRSLEQRLGAPVEGVDPTRAAMLTDRITASNDVAARLAPLVGTLLRSRRRAVAA
jgi:Tfp pilus assembly PilM family ATPase